MFSLSYFSGICVPVHESASACPNLASRYLIGPASQSVREAQETEN